MRIGVAARLDAYEQALTIAKQLAERDKTNTGWQRDLSISYQNVGKVLDDQARLPEALEAYRNYLAIADRLTNRDPSNTTWQGDAACGRWCVAKILIRIKDGDRGEARRLVAEGIEMMTRLKHRDAMDRYANDVLNKLNELANELNSSSRQPRLAGSPSRRAAPGIKTRLIRARDTSVVHALPQLANEVVDPEEAGRADHRKL